MTTSGTIANDTACTACGARPEQRTCSACGQTAMITDCGHQDQPRPIAAGRVDGSQLDRAFCAFCAVGQHGSETCYRPDCEPHRNGCESPDLGGAFVRHTEDGWTVAWEDGNPTNRDGTYATFATRSEAEARAALLSGRAS